MAVAKIGKDFTGNLIFRHKGCGTVRVNIGKENLHSAMQLRRFSQIEAEGFFKRGWRGEIPPEAVCPGCERTWNVAQGEPVYGRYSTVIVCGSKCTGATGPSCDCSCGGENHGGGFAA